MARMSWPAAARSIVSIWGWVLSVRATSAVAAPAHIIETDRVRELDARYGDSDAARERATASVPLRRYGAPDEFGRTADFLLSPVASYLTEVMVRSTEAYTGASDRGRGDHDAAEGVSTGATRPRPRAHAPSGGSAAARGGVIGDGTAARESPWGCAVYQPRSSASGPRVRTDRS